MNESIATDAPGGHEDGTVRGAARSAAPPAPFPDGDAAPGNGGSWRALFDVHPAIMLLIDPATAEIVDANAAACDFYGRPRAELCRIRITDVNVLPGERVLDEMDQARRDARHGFEFRHRLASGDVRDVEVTSGPVVLEGRELLYSIVTDVTERRRLAAQAERLQNLYAASLEIGRTIARATDARAMYEAACRIAVERGAFRMAWVGVVREDGWVTPVASAGTTGTYLDAIRVSVADVPEGRGPVGTSIRERRAVVSEDIHGDPRMETWREQARTHGYAAMISLPLGPADSPTGALAAYADLPGGFSPSEVELLERLASDIGFRLEAISRDEARRAAEDALRASEERYRTLIEQATDGIMVTDAEGRFIDVNSAACAMVRYQRDEMLGLTLMDLVPPDLHGVLPRMRRALRERETSTGERQLLRKDGTIVLVDMAGGPLSDGRFQSIVRDVTARRAEQAERERLIAAVEQAVEGIVMTDETGRVVYANSAIARITGFPSEEVLGRTMEYMQLSAGGRDAFETIRATLRSGQSWAGVVAGRRRDGQEVELDLAVSPIFDVAGRFTGAVGVARDVTRERALEVQLTLAHRLEAIGRLAGAIAHDFNNLLTAISGFAQLAASEVDPGEPVADDIDEIMKATDRAAALTRQLLAFSRRQVMQPRVIDLNEIVADLAPMLRRLLGEDVELVVLPGDALGRTLADPGQIEQVLVNLAVNARDAMPDGGRLTIDTANTELDVEYARQHVGAQPGPHVRLTVSDTGQGMDAETLSHAFEPFFTTKERGRGTGLGLSTVLGIVQQSHGSIHAYSEEGQGSAFRIYLPRVDTAATDLQAPIPIVTALDGTETILVAEDEDAVRQFVGRVLADHGYRALLAVAGPDALALAAAHEGEIALLFTDMVMPGMSGSELAARLTEARPSVRVLYASGYTEDSIVHRGVLDPGIRFLAKPYSADALLLRVREILDEVPAG